MVLLTFRTYALVTLLSTAAIVAHAFATRQQFFRVTVYLSTQKTGVFVLANFGLFLLLTVAKILRFVLFGKLHENEQRVLRERAWFALTESLLALTMFREDFHSTDVPRVAVLFLVKVCHWLAQERIDHLVNLPRVTIRMHARLVMVLGLLLLHDGFMLYNTVISLLQDGPSLELLFAYETAVMSVVWLGMTVKYLLTTFVPDTVDTGFILFLLEVVTHGLQLLACATFVFVFTSNFGLPFYILPDLYATAQLFRQRLGAFVVYRRLVENFDTAFPDAQPDELADQPRCVVCTEEMTSAKRLACGHKLHGPCLRRWLQQQPRCPICRSAVAVPGARPAQAQAQAQAQPAAGFAAAAAAAPEQAAPGAAFAPQGLFGRMQVGVPAPQAAGAPFVAPAAAAPAGGAAAAGGAVPPAPAPAQAAAPGVAMAAAAAAAGPLRPADSGVLGSLVALQAQMLQTMARQQQELQQQVGALAAALEQFRRERRDGGQTAAADTASPR